LCKNSCHTTHIKKVEGRGGGGGRGRGGGSFLLNNPNLYKPPHPKKTLQNTVK